MKITKDQVVHVADLARLHLGDEEIERFAGQIDTILEYVDKLDRADTEGVSPTSHAISLTNAFREDAPLDPLDREAALANAPERDGENFIVPRVIR